MFYHSGVLIKAEKNCEYEDMINEYREQLTTLKQDICNIIKTFQNNMQYLLGGSQFFFHYHPFKLRNQALRIEFNKQTLSQK